MIDHHSGRTRFAVIILVLLVAASAATTAFAQSAPAPPAPAAKTASKPDSAAAKPDSAAAPVPAAVQAEKLLMANKPDAALVVARHAMAEDPNNPYAWFVLARAYHATGDLDSAIVAGHHAANFAAVRASAFYNLACAYALKGDKESAFRALMGAKRAGFADRDLMASDPDLKSLHDDPRWVLPVAENYFTLKLKDGTDLPFAVTLPVHFDPAKTYPVLIAPGVGKKVKGTWGGLFWGEDTAQRGWIAVESPSLLLKDPVAATSQLLDEIGRRYKVEGGKVHIVCYGPAADPGFQVAMAMPERIRSITAVPGFPVTTDDAQLKKLKGVEVSFIVGQNDPFSLNACEVAHHELQKLGVDAYMEVVRGAGQEIEQMFGGELVERLDLMR